MMLSPGTSFLLLFTGLYLVESVTLCREGAVIFYRGITGAVRYRFAKDLPVFGRSRLFLAPPFPLSSMLFVSGEWPEQFSGQPGTRTDRAFDREVAGRMIAAVTGKTALLSAVINILFVYCFLIVPVTTWLISVEATWTLLLVLFLVQASVAVIAFVEAHRRIHPSRGVPWSRVISMILYTPSLLRCMDVITRSSVSEFHPAAVGCAVLRGEQLKELLSYYYRDYTMRPGPDREGREHLAQRVLEAAEKKGITRGDLLAPPERKDGEINSYCPLCHEQYVLESGICSECGTRLAAYTRS